MKFVLISLLLIGSVFADEDDRKEDVGTVVGIDLGTTYSWYVQGEFIGIFDWFATFWVSLA